MPEALKSGPRLSIAPDRGKELSGYRDLGKKLGVKFYFPLPRQPRQRGANEIDESGEPSETVF